MNDEAYAESAGWSPVPPRFRPLRLALAWLVGAVAVSLAALVLPGVEVKTFGAALLVVYLILGILYESYIHPLTILSTLPSAGAGALATLMLFGFDFSLVAMIGVILLIGIVKKNGIMLVDFAIAAEREGHLSTEDAIRKASLLRFRPIMMTTMAALLGGVPLMLGTGTGAEIRQPLGYAMVGGLLVSQALTLFTTPVIYIYLDKLSNFLFARIAGEGEAAGGEPAE